MSITKSISRNILSVDYLKTKIEISIDDLNMTINGVDKFSLDRVYNDKIIDAYLDGKVFINTSEEEIKRYRGNPLYYCARNIYNRKINDSNLYLDFLCYNDDINILPNNTVNRSLGHNNDIREFEVHQVLSGTILSIIKIESGENYVGVFKKGDYFEIPPGAFHCSYILEGPAIVANFYCNAYWESNIEQKPYFNSSNDITVEKRDSFFVIKTKSSRDEYLFSTNTINEDLSLTPLKPYNELFLNGILHTDYKLANENIFELFYSNILNPKE
jgi:hypothetical protein